MKIISIIKNDITNTDLALYFKDNYSDDDAPSTPLRNATTVSQTKSGMPILQIEFWRNEKFKKYFLFGEKINVIQDEDTDFNKRGRPWPDFVELYESF